MADALPKAGEWWCYRRDSTLQARSGCKGEIKNPTVAWKQFIGVVDTLLVVEPGTGKQTINVPSKELVSSSSEYENPRWGLTPLGELEGRQQPISRSLTTTYADILPDVPGLEKIEFESGFSKPTINNRWQPCVGRCFAWKDGGWVKIWETEIIEMIFHPLPIVGDFDGDGNLEVAVLPWEELLIFDARTGKIKGRCKFTEGRSYGYFSVYDLDGDGKSEFVVQADFCKHVDVLGYRDGKLTLLWQHPIELGLSSPQKVLRVNPNTVADVDGDGKLEVIVNLYNESGDNRWHVTVHDGMTGAVKADLRDEYLNGLVDVDGDGISEILTTRTKGNGVPAYGPIVVHGFKAGRMQTLWECADAGWQEWDRPQPPNVNSSATLGNRDVLWRLVDGRAWVVLRKKSKNRPEEVCLSLASWTEKGFETLTSVKGHRLEALAYDEKGSALIRCSTSPDAAAKVRVTSGKAQALHSMRKGPCPCIVATAMEKHPMMTIGPAGRVPPACCNVTTAIEEHPIVIVQGAREELVAFRPPHGDKPAAECWRVPGRGQGSGWDFQIFGPVVADLYSDGRRQHIYATAAPSGCGRLVVSDMNGKVVWHHDFPRIPGTPPVWNTGGVVLWQVGHFTDKQRQDVLVTVRRSIMHTEETFLLSGQDGKELWHRDHQISERGAGGQLYAIADFDGDGLDDAASLYPSLVYILKGTNGHDVLAMDASWDEVPTKPVYWGIPVAVNLNGESKASVFFASGGGTMTGLVRPDGSLVWWDAVEKSAKGYPAFGDFDGDGKLEAIGIGYPEDGIRCYDTATGKIKWRMPMPAQGIVTGTASADINSDGRDEALFVIGSTLYCVAATRDGDKGQLLWKIDLPAGVGSPTIADVDGHGKASILLAGADGYVYCVR